MLLIVACKYRLIQKDQQPGLTRVSAPELRGTTEEKNNLINMLGEPNGDVVPERNGLSKAEPYKPLVCTINN